MKRPNILFVFSGRGNYLNCTQRHRDTELFVIVIVIVKTLCVFVSLCSVKIKSCFRAAPYQGDQNVIVIVIVIVINF